jgi:hypothetical protein
VLRADAVAGFSAEAFDENGHRLSGRRLTWYAGRRVLGHGAQLTLIGLPAGRMRLRLVARDRRGRRASATETIRVTAVPPMFTSFRAPRRVSRRVRHVALSVASNVPAVLLVSGHGVERRSYLVTRRSKRVLIGVTRGRGTLHVRLTLRTRGARRTSVVLSVAR